MLNKFDFVQSLLEFYLECVGNPEQVADMSYVQNGGEWIYVTFESGDQKRFCVNGDSNQGILQDFCKFLRYFDDYEWLRESEKR